MTNKDQLYSYIMSCSNIYKIENILNILETLNVSLWNLTTCANCVYHYDCKIENMLPGDETTKFCSFGKLKTNNYEGE